MSAMPPPPGGDQPGFESAPQYSYQGDPAQPTMTSAPTSIVRAKYAMWAGAALHLLTILTSFLTLDDMRSQVEDQLEQ